MVKVVFTGWRIGAKKIPFIKLLSEQGGLSLTKAKEIKDKIIDRDEVVEIDIESESIAQRIIDEANKLGINCEMKKIS